MDTIHAEKFIPIKNAAPILGVSAAWLKSEAEAGRIPALRTGRRLLVNLSTIERVLMSRATSGGEQGASDAR